MLEIIVSAAVSLIVGLLVVKIANRYPRLVS